MSLISDQQIEQFHELGYFLTEPMFTDEQLEVATNEFDRLWADCLRAAEESGDEKLLDLYRYRPFLGQAHSKSAALTEFIKAPIYLEACAKLIGPDADLYYNQAVIKPPENGRPFGWHQDSGYTETSPLRYITCWTAISRCFVENGCIWIIPGSHKNGLVPHQFMPETMSIDATDVDESSAIPVEMQPGQVAIFSSLMLHKSGANTSSEIRRGYVPQYHVPGVVGAKNGELFGDQFPVLRQGVLAG